MLYSGIVLWLVALFVCILALSRGVFFEGFRSFGGLFLGSLPLLFGAFLIVGMVLELVPSTKIVSWVGSDSGIRGLLTGSLIGVLTPGGVFVSMPVAGGMISGGAGIGPVVSFLSSWMLLGLGRLPFEIGLLGWRFVLIRILSVLVFPLLAGFTAQFLSGILR